MNKRFMIYPFSERLLLKKKKKQKTGRCNTTSHKSEKHDAEQKSHATKNIYMMLQVIRSLRTGKNLLWQGARG